MENKRGRPEKTDEERRDYRFQIRLSDEERELLEKASDNKVSSWARKTLVDAAKRRLKDK
jgi:hypothetical protein